MISSCKKDPEPMTTNSMLIGNVQTWNINPSNEEIINIKAFGPYGYSTTKSGLLGQFSLSGLGNGTYRLEYSLNGYGTKKMYNIQIFGSDTVNTGSIFLFPIPDYFNLPEFKNVSIGTDGFNPSTVVIEVSLASSTGVLSNPLPVVIFADSLETVSSKSYNYSLVNEAYSSTQPVKKLYLFDTYGLPFPKGSKVFFIAYVCNRDEIIYSDYFDPYLGIKEFSTLIDRHSSVMSFIMP